MNEKKKKRLSTPIILLLILVGITVALCLTVFGLWLHGRSQLTKNTAAPEMGGSSEKDYIIEHNGKYYQYNKDMCNILLMGIDADEKPTDGDMEAHQADVLVLAALNLSDGKMTLLSVPRDTMCDIQVLNDDGSSAGVANAQVALSYAYGTTLSQCSSMCRDAVSSIFHGLPIQGTAAFYMGGVSELNDAVGGVTVTILDDYPFSSIPGYGDMVAGEEMTLNGDQAQMYIRCRLEEQVDSNALRMQRQKQYLLSMIMQAKQMIKEQPTKALNLYNVVGDYIVTDLDLGRISYLATAAAGMDFSGDITTLKGDLALGAGNHAELTLDQEALYDLMLDVFYNEVPAPTSKD